MNDRTEITGEAVKKATAEELINAYTELVQGFSNRYSGATKNTGVVDREDLIQEGWIAILQARETYIPEEGGVPFSTWAIGYIKNRMRRAIGYNSRGILKETPELLLDAPAAGEEGNTPIIDLIPDDSIGEPDDAIIKAEEEEEIREAVENLRSENQRKVIQGLYFEEMTYQELADREGKSFAWVRQQRKKALEALRVDWERRRRISEGRYKGSLGRFRITRTSAVEAEILRKEELYNSIHGKDIFPENERE